MPNYNNILPVSPLDVSGLFGGNSLEQQRLDLMKQEFENTKRKQAEEAAWARTEEAGRNAREQMVDRRDREAQAAAQKAKIDEAKRATYAKFSELNGQGKYDEARAMLPEMNSLGMSAELLGETGGLPTYRVHMSPEEAKAAEQQGIGYPQNDSAKMQVQPGISSTEDAFKQAQSAAPGITNAETDSLEAGGTNFQASKPPDQPDYTGAVPNDVIDTGAIAAAAKARAAAMFPGLASSLPGPYQQSAQNTSNAVLAGIGSGAISGKDALDFYSKSQQEANSRIQNQMTEEGTNQRAAATQAGEASRAAASRSDQNYKTGLAMAEKANADYDVKGYLTRRRSYQDALAALGSKDPADAAVAASSIIRLMGDNHISNADVDRVLGGSGLSLPEEVAAKLHQWAVGGMPGVKRDALTKLLRTAQGADEKNVNDYLNNAYNFIGESGNDADQKRGYEASVKTVIPEDKRREFLNARNANGQKAADGAPEFRMDQNPEPDNSFRADQYADIQIPPKTIAARHNNPGNLKYAGQSGATKGEPAEDGGYWAKFSSPQDGADAMRKQVIRDAKKGLTVGEYISKYAPPGSNDTELYIKQALQALHAKRMDPLSSVDVDAMVRFQAQKESGTKIGAIPAQKSASARYAELLAKENG